MSSSSESEILTPEDIKLNAETVINNFLPKRSREKYLKTYEKFISWQNEKETKSFSETVFLEYFEHIAKNKQPTTLWSIYSMLKSTVYTKNHIQLDKYSKLIAYLKKISEGHKSKKSKVFTSEDVETFLTRAPDKEYLAMKVALIFGIHGACRGQELLNLNVKNIEKHSEHLLLVNLKDTKTKVDRSFTIRGQYKRIVEKYQKLRPTEIDTNRFFIRYQNGRCFRQNIGKNKISKMPEEIAIFLELPDSHLYTGHCFRRTSATLLTNLGADLTILKNHGSWKFSGVAEGCSEDSIKFSKDNLEKKVVGEFLVMYKNLPCLWDVTDQFYTNTAARNRAHGELVEKYKELDSECDINKIKKKIGNMRTAYRRERQRVKGSKLPNGEQYEPHLWYYPLLSFLEQSKNNSNDDSRDNESLESTQAGPDEASTASTLEDNRFPQVTSTEAEITNEDIVKLEVLVPETERTIESMSPNYEEDIGIMTVEPEVEVKYQPEIQPEPSAVYTTEKEFDNDDATETPRTKTTKRRKNDKSQSDSTSIKIEDDVDEDDLFLPSFESGNSSGFPENDMFAKIMTAQLSELRPRQRFIAQKLMSEVIFFGRLDKLKTETKLLLDGD